MKVDTLRKYCVQNRLPYRGLRKHQLEEIYRNHSFRQSFLSEFNFEDDIITKSIQRKSTRHNKQKDLHELPRLINPEEEEVKVVRSRGAWGDMIVDYAFYYDNVHDLYSYLYNISNNVIDKINSGFKRMESMKVQLIAIIQYELAYRVTLSI